MTLKEAEKRIAALEEKVRELREYYEVDPKDYAAALTAALRRTLSKGELTCCNES